MTKLVKLGAILLPLVGCGSNQSNVPPNDSGPDSARTGGAMGTGGNGPDYTRTGGAIGTGGNGSDVTSDVVDVGVCMWPSAFNPAGNQTGPIPSRCRAYAPSGLADGGMVSCSSAEYSLVCFGDSSLNAPIPAPNSSLGCRILPLPTPSDQSYYCCPCGEGLDGNPFSTGASDGAVTAEDAPGQDDALGREDGAACYPLFHACASDGECCAPNRCLNITGTLQCEQEGPKAGGPDAGPDVASVTLDARRCVWPASVTETGDAGASGCWAHAAFNVCEVPNGGSVNADGTITGPDGKPVTNACHDACSASQYALTCTGEMSSPGVIPSPDSSLGCRVVRGPTPSNETVYCCPCGED